MALPPLSATLRRYRENLTRSSAIQQGLLNLSIFLISLLLLSITTYFFVQDALSNRADNDLRQRMSVLQERLSDDDWEEEDDEGDSPYKKLNQSMQGDDFFLVLTESDLELDNNKAFSQTGLSTRVLKRRNTYRSDKNKDTRYRILVEKRDGMVFVVGINNDNDQEIIEIVMSAFMLNALIAMIFTALLVIYLANRSHRQIRLIEHVLNHAAQGDLKQRIGPSDKNNDLGHVSDQIDTMLSRLETSMTAMTDISANIAHELKTPISRLRHDLITALDQHEQGKDVEAALNDAYEETGYITETFDALLRIAQIEGGARRANFTSLNLQSVIETVLDIYIEVAEDAGMTLQLAAPSTAQSNKPVMIQGDKELLVQMLANLIENAIRYCPEGTTISVECVERNGRIQLSVADNGAGIPEAEREQVFQRLYRVDKSRSDKRGTGLGLSLVKAIIELHHATITLEDNKPGLRAVILFTP
ncbi:sensor histidine kinase [Leucothrix mucor]|uniref:sensor histidine kinase n=1 Tax=Leucothrix mucor TaxID=45248 RepID=UPI0003B30470|nr:ATP-binding protein [Leucothrix mucor]